MRPRGDLRALSAGHARDVLSGSHFQLVHQVVVGFFAPLSRIESGVEFLDFADGHELILHVPFDEQADVAACVGMHCLYVLPEDGAPTGMGFEVTA